MFKGYVIIVKDYRAEIVEFRTIEIIEAPDGMRIFHVDTKYGDKYYKEFELSPIRKALEKECEAINEKLAEAKALQGGQSAGSNHKIY